MLLLPLPIPITALIFVSINLVRRLSIVYFTMQKNFLRLLLILLGLSYVLFASAIPATRAKKLNGEDASALPSIAQLDALKLGNDVAVDEEFVRRMDLETQDYGGTGANNAHDPKSPGRV